MKVLLACDTYERNPWARDRLVAIKKALSETTTEFKIIDIYDYKGLKQAHKIHQKRAKNHFNRLNIAAANEGILNKILDYKPDLCVFGTVDNYDLYLSPMTILKIREHGIKVVGILGDDEFTWKRNQLFVPYFDKVMVYVREYERFYNQIVDGVSYYLPNSCYLVKEERPEVEEIHKRYDVALIGAPFGPRPEMVRLLDEAGVNICVFGSSAWLGKIRDPKMYKGYIPHDGFDEICLHSKIILAPLEDHITGQLHMNTKIWEAVRAGQLPITSHYKPLFDDYGLIEGETIVTYRDYHELVEKVKFYVDNPDQRKKVADALYAKVYQHFNYDRLYKEFFLKMKDSLTKLSLSRKRIGNVFFVDYKKVLLLMKGNGGVVNDFFQNLNVEYIMVINDRCDNHLTEEAVRIAVGHFKPTTSVLLYQSAFDEFEFRGKISSIFKVLFTKDDFLRFLDTKRMLKANVRLGKPITLGFGRLRLLGVKPQSVWDFLFDFWNTLFFIKSVGTRRVLKFLRK